MKNFLVTLTIAIASMFITGCAATLTSAISGPLTGGASLTEKLYQSKAKPATKMMATPATFLGGTATGLFPALAQAIRDDSKFLFEGKKYDEKAFTSLFDPFDSGMFPDEEKK